MKRVLRVLTGTVRFDSDWPGLFIRGDAAVGYAEALRAFLEKRGRLPERWALEGLRDKLEATRQAPDQEVYTVLTADLERRVIVTWLRALGRRCPSLGMRERQSWYEGVADDIEHGNVTLEAIRKQLLEEQE